MPGNPIDLKIFYDKCHYILFKLKSFLSKINLKPYKSFPGFWAGEQKMVSKAASEAVWGVPDILFRLLPFWTAFFD